MTDEIQPKNCMIPSPQASSPPAEYERAAAELCKRIAAGFGVADHDKFAGFCAEVTWACRNFSAAEIAEAADDLMRSPTRPHVGDVFRVLAGISQRARRLEAARERAARVATPRPARTPLTAEQVAAVKARVDARFNSREGHGG